jgi:restriction endonuclease S subunit
MINWPTKKLGEVAQLRMGETLIKKDLTGDGVPVYSADSLETPWGYTSKNKIKFRRGAIVIGARGTIGSLKLPEDDYFASTQTTIVVEPNIKEILPEFLFYFLSTLNFRKGGTGIPMITIGYLKTIKAPLPPLNIQQKIVERLDAIKNAQELNDKQIELAEELFQSLLHRELDPKGKNWEVKKLGEICDCKDGDWILTKDLQTGNDVRLIQLGDIGEINFLDKTHKYISKKRCQELSCTLLKPNDILLNRMGDPIGIACILPHLSYPAITAVDVTIIRSKKEIANQFFILYSLNSKAIRRQIEAFATGSTRRRISRKNLEKTKIPLPPLETQQKIVEKLSAVQEYKKKLLDQKQKLQELFESVLNKSFKGELI